MNVQASSVASLLGMPLPDSREPDSWLLSFSEELFNFKKLRNKLYNLVDGYAHTKFEYDRTCFTCSS